MKDLFDTILINELKMRREPRARRKATTAEERQLESEALYDAMGGTYSDRSFFDLDNAIASRTRSGRGESLEDFEVESDGEY